MATVYKKPDPLSLAGNLNNFEITSSTNVRFKLSKGSTLLLDHTYEPGEDNRIVIDIKQVVFDNLEFTLKASETSYIQDKIAADFVADIDGTQIPFRAVRTGVSNLADTPENWLKLHFLTWQPTQKKVTYYSPEYLTYYATVAGNLKIQAYFDDGSSSEKILHTCTAGKAYTVNTQYAIVTGIFSNKLPMYYDVYFVNNNNVQISETQRYLADTPISDDETWILWENSLGGYDTARVAGINTLDADHTHNIATVDDISFEYEVDTERKYTKNSGFLNEYERRWLLDFFPARNKYIYTGSTIRKIVVTEDNVTYKSNDLPSSYTFTYKFAESGSFLNLQKRNDLPAGLTIPVPSLPDFSLPPRIAEYPRIPLSEGVLLPVQDPNSDHIGITSLGALKNFIILGLDESGLSIIETLKDWASDQFLSKVQPDTAKEIITFEKGIQIGNSFIREVDGVLTFSNSIASEKSVSARGASTSTGSGTLTSLDDLVDVDLTGKKKDSILIFNGTHWVIADGSDLRPDLSGYATESWVNEQGFLKPLALADYATTTYVNARISDIIAGAPGAFDTLKEIADVLSGNVDSIGDIITTLGTKWTQDDTKITNWNSAFGWGDHAVAGYLTAAEFATYFKKDAQGRIYTDLDFYSTKSVSARGAAGSSGSGTLTSLDDLVDVDLTGKKKDSLLMFNGTHWVVEDGSNISPDLTGYATESWVNEQGFLKASNLSGYATETWVGNKYLPLSGGTLSGSLSVDTLTIKNTGAAEHLKFTRANANYFTTPTNGYFSFIPGGKAINAENATAVIGEGYLYPGKTNTYLLGTNGYRWSNVYSVNGNFSGTVSATGNIVASTHMYVGNMLYTNFIRGNYSGAASDVMNCSATTTNLGQSVGTTYLRSGDYDLIHIRNGISRTIWDASNSNLPTVDWTTKDLLVKGIFRTQTIYSSVNGSTMLESDGANIQLGFSTGNIFIRTGNSDIRHRKNGADYTVWDASNFNPDSKIDQNTKIIASNFPDDQIGYGYSADGWFTAGPAMAFGNGGYTCQMQLEVGTGSDFKFRSIYNNAARPWNKFWHSGNSNLSTVDWVTKNLTASGSIHTTNGALITTQCGCTLTIGSGNTTWVHFNTDIKRDFYFHNSIAVNGNIYPYVNNGSSCGTSSKRWAWIYGSGGDFSGNVSVGNELVFSEFGNKIISGSASYFSFLSSTGTAKGICVGSLTVSSSYSNYSKSPAFGIYSQGNITTDGYYISPATNQVASEQNMISYGSYRVANKVLTSGNCCPALTWTTQITEGYISRMGIGAYRPANSFGSMYFAIGQNDVGTSAVIFTMNYSGLKLGGNYLTFPNGNSVASTSTGFVGFYTNGSAACSVAALGMTLSDNYSDVSKRPAYGIYSKGEILSASNIKSIGSVTARTASDIRLKENFRPVVKALDIIAKLTPFYYTWRPEAFKLDSGLRQGYDIGLSAQDVKKYLPAASIPMWNDYLGIDYAKITPLIIAGMREFSNWKDKKDIEIERLRKRVETLENQLKAA